MSLENLKPFVSIYSTFLQRGYDEIQQDIARMSGNVVIGIDRAGIVGEDGETHQGIYDISFLSSIPNMIIMAPADAEEASNMLYTAFNTPLPVAIRYSKASIDASIPKKSHSIKIGTWPIISYPERIAADGYIISYGDFLSNALLIQEALRLSLIHI